MATTTATIFEATSGSFMLPGMPSPEPIEASMGRVVRFDNECILIPNAVQPSKLPLVLTRSYSLPLWKKKGNQQLSDSSDAEDAAAGPSNLRSPSPEESRARVVIKVPFPLFRRKASRSPTPRGRSISSSPVIPKAMPPCLVHRSPSMSPGSVSLSPVRRPSLPVYQRRTDELTVPLRPCCEACEHITDQSLKEGELWQEKFSRGARRRRSASLEHNDFRGLSRKSSHTRANSFGNDFFALTKSVNEMVESSRYGSPPFCLTVDEVDKRRKSCDFSPSSLRQGPSSGVASSSSQSPGSPYSGSARYPRHRPHERDFSSSSTLSSASTTDELVPEGLDPRNRLRSSPIEEEDEAQLFPLPSPRRSPSGTPSPSPSPRNSPIPSPNASTSCLPAGKSPSPAASSNENISPSKVNPSQESLLKASLSRKQTGAYLGSPTLSSPRSTSPVQFSSGRIPSGSSPLASSPIAAASPTSPGLPTTHGMKFPTSPRSGERASAGPLYNSKQEAALTEFPTSSPVSASSVSTLPPSRTNEKTAASTTTKPLPPLRLTTVSIKPVAGFPTSSPISIPSSPKTPAHGRTAHSPSMSPLQAHSHTPIGHHPSASQSSTTSTSTPTSPHSPTSPRGLQKRKVSFTRPFIKAGEAIRDVSVDVLKGVSSISSGGIGVI